MIDYLFAGSTGWFTIPAAIGTFIFILRVAFMLFGGVGHADVDLDVDADVDFDVDVDVDGDAGHPDPGHAFQVLSVQSVASFLMGFGWGGLGAYRGAGWDIPMSIVFAIGVGAFFTYVLATLLKMTYRLEASGNLSIRDAVGTEGSVYVTVPAHGEGAGQITVIMANRQRIYGAVTESTEPIPRHARVKIIGANDAQTVSVMPLT